MIVRRWSTRYFGPLMFAGSAILALWAGIQLGRGYGEIPMPVLLASAAAGAIVLFTIRIEHLFLGWLFVAPLFQNAADASTIGKALSFALYLAPAAVLACQTLGHWRKRSDVSVIDVFPAIFAAVVVVSGLVSSSLLSESPTGFAKELFQRTLIGVVIYYFLVFGPGAAIRTATIFRALVAGALLQAALSIVEWGTGWSVWGRYAEYTGDISRTTATLSSPGALGAYLGCGIVLALAVIAWSGPKHLRRLSWIMVAVGVPGLFATLTRGPILATLVAGLGLLLLSGRARILTVGIIVASAFALVQFWPQIEQAELYQQRFGDRVNVEGRADIQDVSLAAAAEKPIFGWGYGSFDTAKLTSSGSFDARVKGSLESTSHNTFLTVLVELGGLGLALMLVPWLVIMAWGVAAVRRRVENAWFLVGCMGAVLVWGITAATTDQKYFSFVNLLPWLLLGAIRRVQSDRGDPSTSSS